MSCDILERTPSRQSSVILERRGSLTDIVGELLESSKDQIIASLAAGTLTESDNEDQTRQVQQIVRFFKLTE